MESNPRPPSISRSLAESLTGLWQAWEARRLPAGAPPEQRVPVAQLRASDADRERVVSVLQEACADGRLTVAEHEERVERAYLAKTLGELAALTADLLPPDRQPVNLDDRPVTALFRKERREGRWVVPPRYTATAIGTTVTLDLREALLQTHHVTLEVTVVGGTLELIVPEGVQVEMPAKATFGDKKNRVRAVPSPQAPLIEITGRVILGSIVAKPPKPPKKGRFRRHG
ncbi:hypothetical protein GCM10010106_32400 [Thermopolyspora flexuosa]|uniref:Uncharacterized protein DUF1707 n=1 Tax=Thermopolyspora flexuosa TaxID=103836 RepID=A0A543ISY5_9ACTN|nr:DUF1707 domain-containing protein [Thermopolyspora flexuosa]TQM73683.1 uncharacterized protein DUF1707 [Thermopolyspora flexuosa]GGM83276.1 hypothetical protein GCM10010106_32400 [Thermopolyspora flexuosa]